MKRRHRRSKTVSQHALCDEDDNDDDANDAVLQHYLNKLLINTITLRVYMMLERLIFLLVGLKKNLKLKLNYFGMFSAQSDPNWCSERAQQSPDL